jgi:integrase
MNKHLNASKQQRNASITTQPEKKPSKWRKVPRTIGLYEWLPSGTYFANISKGNKLYRESLHTKDLAVAKRKLRDFRARLDRTDACYGKISLVEWLERFYFPTLKGASSTLADKWRIIARVKATWLAARAQPMRDLKPSAIAAWLNEWYGNQSVSSYNGALCLLRDGFQAAVNDHVIVESPCAHLRYRKRERPIRLTPSWPQFEALIADIRAQRFNADAKESANFLEFMGLAGLGQAEVSGIQRAHVDLASNRIAIFRHKTSIAFHIPIYPQLRPLIEQLCAGKKPTERLFKLRQARRALAAACRRLQYANFTQRSLRRMFVTMALQKGVDVQTVSRWQGHRDNGALILSTYAHVRTEHSNRMALMMVSGEQPENIVPMQAQERESA